jgi:hypothetical protein
MKSSFHSLIPFLPLFCSSQFQRLDSIKFQAHIPAGWRLKTRPFTSLYAAEHFLITTLHGPRWKHTSIVNEECLLICCLAIDALLLRALAHAGMFLPSRCLAIGVYVTILMSSIRLVWSVYKVCTECTEFFISKSERHSNVQMLDNTFLV